MTKNEYYKALNSVKEPYMSTGKSLLQSALIISRYETYDLEEIEIKYKLDVIPHYVKYKNQHYEIHKMRDGRAPIFRSGILQKKQPEF
jgi:hypothetical protein